MGSDFQLTSIYKFWLPWWLVYRLWEVRFFTKPQFPVQDHVRNSKNYGVQIHLIDCRDWMRLSAEKTSQAVLGLEGKID